MKRPRVVVVLGLAVGYGLTQSCTPFGSSGSPSVSTDAATEAGSLDGQAPTPDASVGTSVGTSRPSTSCADLLQNRPELKGQDGEYTLTLANGAVSVWCDMTTNGGGYTLVARSTASGGSDGFGWRAATGSITVDSAPYSLDLQTHPVPFTEILIGEAMPDSKAWGAHVFAVFVPKDFLSHGQASVPLTDPSVIRGCAPNLNVHIWMFNFAGFTANTDDIFFFRDQDIYQPMGLADDGFHLADACCGGNNCDRSVELNGKQGMLMVR